METNKVSDFWMSNMIQTAVFHENVKLSRKPVIIYLKRKDQSGIFIRINKENYFSINITDQAKTYWVLE